MERCPRCEGAVLYADGEPSCLTCGWAGAVRAAEPDEPRRRSGGGPTPAGRRGAGAGEVRGKVLAAMTPGEESSARELRERLWAGGLETSASTVGDAIRGLLRDGASAERALFDGGRRRLYRLAGDRAAADAGEAA